MKIARGNLALILGAPICVGNVEEYNSVFSHQVSCSVVTRYGNNQSISIPLKHISLILNMLFNDNFDFGPFYC